MLQRPRRQTFRVKNLDYLSCVTTLIFTKLYFDIILIIFNLFIHINKSNEKNYNNKEKSKN